MPSSEGDKTALEMVTEFAKAWPEVCDGLAPAQLRYIRDGCAEFLAKGWVSVDFIVGIATGWQITVEEIKAKIPNPADNPMAALVTQFAPAVVPDELVLAGLMIGYMSVELLEGRAS